ncbi:hypothetical protein GCM10027346_39170 [Hymenobacter seoulensis]|uniref:DUF5990 family protein n=1 Tax=unclassified Hymenobacter TaxID=2615202 RepID=UPI001651150B|nr:MULTISPECIES: DUF5990 family protein [unclassified Hymenobacter]MBC6700285.1 hypothetical protein [Hymenobacter sp. BT190]MCR5890503.1 DUF5990 family protein [Hymenobacter sp. J193]MCR5890599.1 DUF5990 family protein [Hymenobacter sp. J193]
MKQLLLFQLQVLDAPVGVQMAVQQGNGELILPVVWTPERLVFEVSLTVSFPKGEVQPRLTGPGVQGPVSGRFLYVNAGTSAGQVNSCWTRRAKVPLPTLTPEMLEQTLSSPGLVLQASIHGQARDGGPACASVRLLGNGWVLAPAFAR